MTTLREEPTRFWGEQRRAGTTRLSSLGRRVEGTDGWRRTGGSRGVWLALITLATPSRKLSGCDELQEMEEKWRKSGGRVIDQISSGNESRKEDGSRELSCSIANSRARPYPIGLVSLL